MTWRVISGKALGSGNTALHFTMQYGFSALADFLLEKGADAALLNRDGHTAYQGTGN
jgi:ankyrin repeat protein